MGTQTHYSATPAALAMRYMIGRFQLRFRMAPSASTTPVMQQYHSAKQEYPDCLLFFRLGDFFELFFEDAVTASADLSITLTKRRNGKGEAIPMCGVPVHSADAYLAKLLAKGHRIAICDQVEASAKSRGLVRREIVRVLSPGTASDLNLLKSGQNNYLAAVHERDGRTGLAYVDVSTGEFRATELAVSEVEDMLGSIGAKEVLRATSGKLFDPSSGNHPVRPEPPYIETEVESWVFDHDYASRLLRDAFKLHTIEGLGLEDHPLAVAASGALLHYLTETQRSALPHLARPAYFEQHDWMMLDPVTTQHLELFDSQHQEQRATLLSAMDRTATPMGARLLRSWIRRPSLDIREIELRLEAVSGLFGDTISRSELHRELKQLHDIERLLARVTLGSAGPRETFHLGSSLRRIPTLVKLASGLPGSRIHSVLNTMGGLEDIAELITETLAEEPPVTAGDGGAIAAGFDPELDELREIQQGSRSFIAQLERRERETTQIDSLKVRYNNVFGFFIEVSKANLAKVPERFDRKQTLVNAERFTTVELKELEAKVLDAEDRIKQREAALLQQLRLEILPRAPRIREAASAVAELDVLRGLSEVAVEYDYSRPRFSVTGELQIEAGRHPVVERMLEHDLGERFIENDAYLDNEKHLLAVITGPNMGGKSTYLRQIALTAIMAQTGSFVPARKAILPLIDRIFTRIGASDNLSLGRSTFMVEMTETAQILNMATERSLVLLDEIGRGTATFDGLAIAWAVVEHIHAKVRAKALFATHYHELTALPSAHDGIFNLHVSARQTGDQLVFLRRIQPGNADKSYGIEVARLAGLPPAVIERARAVLAEHERDREIPADATPVSAKERQGSIFEPLPDTILEELRHLDLDRLTPIEAISLLDEWQQRLDD